MSQEGITPLTGRPDRIAVPGDAAPAGPHHEQPHTQSWLAPPLMALARVILRFPVPTLALSIALSAVCLVYTVTHLGYKSSRLDLLNPKSDYNRLWIEYINEFGDEDDAVLVVEGTSRDQVVPVLTELSTALARDQRLFHAILHEVDLSKIRDKGLHYLPPKELQAIGGFLDEATAITAGQWSQLQIGNLVAGYMQRLQAADSGIAGIDAHHVLEDFERLVEGLLAQFSAAPHYQSPWPGMPSSLSTLSELGSEYLLTKEGRLGFVLLRIAVGKDEFARGSEAIDTLRDLIAVVSARHPDVKIGLTGLPIMENDEMRASQSSMIWSSALSFIGVVIVIVAGFGGLRHALLANVALLLGTAWAFGYATLIVGHLNILSVTFTATLIGIGIDYGTYYVSRYMQLRRDGADCEPALLETMRTVGPSIVTGSLTTAVAFLSAALTSFTGIAELGLIASGGLLLCAVSQLVVLPPMIKIWDASRFGQSMPAHVPVHTWINPLLRAPRLVLATGLALTVVAGVGIPRLWYDHNLLNMQAHGLESVELERKLLAECDQSMWYALSIAGSRDELLARKNAFLKLPSVERCEEIVSLLPTDQSEKQTLISGIHDRLAALPERPPLIPVDTIEGLGELFARAQELSATRPDGAPCARRIEQLREALRRLAVADCYAKLSQFQQYMAGDLLSRMHALRSVSNPEPPQLTDLPPSLVNRFVGNSGKYLLKIYGHGDIWNMESLQKFVHDVRSVDPRVTGNPLQAYEASLEMKRSFEQAAAYALLVILGVLYLDFRNITHCVLASLPLALGMVITLGLMGFVDEPLNPANMIALPLLLGMGIDYGVHIVHEFLEQSGRYRISASTAVAVLVDSLTTIIAFAGLMIASHRGLQSLGRVLTIGVMACTLTSIILLPALLAWITRHRPLVPWVADAVQSYEHRDDDPSDSWDADAPARRAA